MNIWHDMNPECITPEKFTAVIEISKGSNCKYELDKYTGLLNKSPVRTSLKFNEPAVFNIFFHQSTVLNGSGGIVCAPNKQCGDVYA